ncbi:hypothetical protein HDV00_009117 [Rhizophlyctis rosea]|nr:hypothetical protein HDV00_009117 [Rhizophlyctis rosea]
MNSDEAILLESLAVLLSVAEELRKHDLRTVRAGDLHYEDADAALDALQLVRDQCNILEDAIRSGRTKGKGPSTAVRAAEDWPRDASNSSLNTIADISRDSVTQPPDIAATQAHLDSTALSHAPASLPSAIDPAADHALQERNAALRSGYASASLLYGRQPNFRSTVPEIPRVADAPPSATVPYDASPMEIPAGVPIEPVIINAGKGKDAVHDAQKFQPVNASNVDTNQMYIAHTEIRADPNQDMSIGLKPGDKLQIVMTMDDGVTALGTNLATGSTGTFPLSHVCLESEWKAASAISVAAQQVTSSALASSYDYSSRSALPAAPPNPVPSSSSSNTFIAPGKYVAIVSHQATSDIEVSFKIGDEIEVISATDDGDMVFGLHLPTKSEGIFRASQLKRLDDASEDKSRHMTQNLMSQGSYHPFDAGMYVAQPANSTDDDGGYFRPRQASQSRSFGAPRAQDDIPSGIPIMPRSASLRSQQQPTSPIDSLPSRLPSLHSPTLDAKSSPSSSRSIDITAPPLTPRGESRPQSSTPLDSAHPRPHSAAALGIDRDSVLALIAAFQEDNAAAYKLYVQNAVPLKEEGKPVPAAMNMELMKQLTENMAQYNWDVEEQERRLRENAAAVPQTSTSTDGVHPGPSEGGAGKGQVVVPPRRKSLEGVEVVQAKMEVGTSSGAGPSVLETPPLPPPIQITDLPSPKTEKPSPSPMTPTPPPVAPLAPSPASEAAQRKSVDVAVERRAAAQAVVDELCETEQHYREELQVFVDHWMTPITTNPHLPKMEMGYIFRNMRELLALSTKVAAQLAEASRRFGEERVLVGNCFLEHVEEWNIYIKYVENFSQAKKTIRKFEEVGGVGGEAFVEALKACQKHPESKRNDIEHYMILPVQRISRYWLLLQRLKKYTDESDPSYEMVEVAEQYMFQIGSVLDHAKRRDDETHRMFEIVLEVEGCPANIISYTQRRYVSEWECRSDHPLTHHATPSQPPAIIPQRQRGDSNAGAKDPNRRVKLFLFSDCFLQCGVRRGREVGVAGKKYDFGVRVDLEGVVVEEGRAKDFTTTLRKTVMQLSQRKAHMANRRNRGETLSGAESAVGGSRRENVEAMDGGMVGRGNSGGISFVDDLVLDELYNKG